MQFDQYYVQGSPGAGGLGTVHRARDLGLNRVVALKVVHPHLARQALFYDRFMAAMSLMARLDHPYIVKIFDFATSRDPLYFVMPYYESNLRQFLRRQAEKRIEGERTAVIGSQIAHALHYAHSQDVVHGNIKLENILMTTAEHVPSSREKVQAHLADFGLASLLEDENEQATPAFTGAWEYMAPERVDGAAATPQTDIYALGVVLYWLLTGGPPFVINNLQDALQKHSHSPVPEEGLADVVPGLREVVLKALAKAPGERYATVSDMAQLLRGIGRLSANASLLSGAIDETVYSTGRQAAEAGESIKAEETIGTGTLPEGSIQGDHISIRQMPNMAFPLAAQTEIVRIGRDHQKNDIVLSSPQVTERHATLKRTRQGWEVRDLESESGVYLDDHRLLPDQEEIWKPQQKLRIGPYTLELNDSNGAGRTEIVAWLEPGTVLEDLQPGQEYITRLQVRNQGTIRDYVHIKVSELDPHWYRLPQDGLPLAPSEQKAVVLYFAVPPSQTAGSYPYQIEVESVLAAQETIEIQGRLNVRTQPLFSVDLYPQHILNKGSCQLTIHNKGNVSTHYTVKSVSTDASRPSTTRFGVLPLNVKQLTPVTTTIRNPLPQVSPAASVPHSSIWQRYVPSLFNNPVVQGYRKSMTALRRGQQMQRDAGRLAGAWPTRRERRRAQFANALLQNVEIEAGEIKQIEFLVETGQRPWQGRNQVETIQLFVEDDITKDRQTAEVQLTTTPSLRRIPRWVSGIGYFLALLLLCGVCWWGVIPLSREVDTLLSLHIYPTAVAAGDADPDDDGKPTTEELRLGLDPLNPDSDGDGVLDGIDPHPLTPDATKYGGTPLPTRPPTLTPTVETIAETEPVATLVPIPELISWDFDSEGRQYLQVGDDADNQAVKAIFSVAVPFDSAAQIQSATIIFAEDVARGEGNMVTLGHLYVQAQLDKRPFGASLPLVSLSSDIQRWQVTLSSDILALMVQNGEVEFVLFAENPTNLNNVQDRLFLYTKEAANPAQRPVLLINTD